jgi:flavin-dependent dehydrogenase
VILAGDAAALVNPLSGEGIFYAIVSGLAAGTAAAAGDERAGSRYADVMRKRFSRHHLDTSVLARLTRMRPVPEAGIRAAGRKSYVFDDLVGLGLAQGTVTPRFTRELCRELLRGLVPGRVG